MNTITIQHGDHSHETQQYNWNWSDESNGWVPSERTNAEIMAEIEDRCW